MAAQNVMRQLADLRKTVQTWRGLEKQVDDLAEMLPLAREDSSIEAEVRSELDKVSGRLDEFELQAASPAPTTRATPS